MLSVGGLCPGCKMPMADHLPSGRGPRAEVPEGKVDVANGRCIVAGTRALQKCCWAQLRDPMTPEGYRMRFEAGAIALEPYPCCGGPLTAWGSFPRKLAEGEPPTLRGLRLLRGRCPNPECPVCTVTHYPCFITPYRVEPTAQREAAVRAHVVKGQPWSKVAKQVPYALETLRRWEREIAARAVEVVIGLLAVWQRLDHRAPAEMLSGGTRRGLLRALFGVCDAVAERLRVREEWQTSVPALAVPRMFRPAAPTTLPVWT